MKEVAKYLYDVYFGDNDIKDIHIKGQRYAVTCTIRMNDTTSTEEDENSKESADEQEIEWKERGVRDTFPFHSGKKISQLLCYN